MIAATLAAAALLAGTATACSGNVESKPAVTNPSGASVATAAGTGTTARPATTGTTSPPLALAPGTVAIRDYAFTPSPLTIKAGTAATWTNQESDPPAEHRVKANPGQQVDFDSGKLAANASYSFVFAVPGEYEYFCAIHDFMKGKVVVTP